MKAIHILEGLQQAELLKMLNTCGLQSENQQLTVQELEENLGIPRTVVSEIFTEDLGKKRVTAKFVLRLLSQEQKEFCAEVAEDLL